MKKFLLFLSTLFIFPILSSCSDNTDYSSYYNLDTFKGLEVYAYPIKSTYKYRLISGTNVTKDDKDLEALPLATASKMKSILKTYDDAENYTSLFLKGDNLDNYNISVINFCYSQLGFKNKSEEFTLTASYIKDGRKVKILNNGALHTIEVAKQYRLTVYFDDILEENYQQLSNNIIIKADSDNVAIDFSYASMSQKYALFYFINKSLNDKTTNVYISYHEQKTVFSFKTIPYDFSKNKINKIDETELNNHIEFKTVLDSTTYHQFTPPYIGIDKDEYDYTSLREGMYSYDFKYDDEGNCSYDINYLKYIPSSFYYPSSFPMINENPVSSRGVTYYFVSENDVIKNSDESIFNMLLIYYGKIDPDHTPGTSSVESLYFKILPKINVSKSESNSFLHASFLLETPYLLLTNYKEQFLEYKVNDLSMYILKISNSLCCYFFDDNYIYNIYVSYWR